MAQFDKSKAYAAQEETFFADGREEALLEFIQSRPDFEQLKGNPDRVLAAIDEYGRTKKYLMNVGEDKGRIVTNLIAERGPKVMVELGGYVGYSALLFASALRVASGSSARYFVLEKSPAFASVIRSLVNTAGLSDIVRVMVGDASESLKQLASSTPGEPADLPEGKIDMLFLDHLKPAYLPDLQLCEELSLIQTGTVLVADNVVKPGNPPYLEYVNMSVEEKRKRWAQTRDRGETPRGNASLVYESRMVHSFEPTGVPDAVEITECIRTDLI